MQALLESNELRKPVCVTPDLLVIGKPTGSVTSPIKHGELFLHPKGDKDMRYRLRWSPDDKKRECPLPAGTYKVTGYRHVKTAKDGKQWVWSTTSAGYAELKVKEGETTHFEVRTKVVARARAIQKKGKHRVGLIFQAEKRLGNTLYREGKRIAIEWQLLDENDEVLSKGTMRYG